MDKNVIHSEDEWVLLFSYGEESAMRQLFKLYYPRLYYFAFQITTHETEAEDIAQEALLLLWQNRLQFAGQTLQNIEAYLFTIARNRCYNHIRNSNTRQKKLDALSGTFNTTDSRLETAIIQEDIFNRIYTEIMQLPPQQAQLLQLVFVDQLSTNEIAQKLQTTPNNIRNQKARAIGKLKTALLKKGLLQHCIIFL